MKHYKINRIHKIFMWSSHAYSDSVQLQMNLTHLKDCSRVFAKSSRNLRFECAHISSWTVQLGDFSRFLERLLVIATPLIGFVIIITSMLNICAGVAQAADQVPLTQSIPAVINPKVNLDKELLAKMDPNLVCLYKNPDFFGKVNQRELFTNAESFNLVRNVSAGQVIPFYPRVGSFMSVVGGSDKIPPLSFEYAICPGEGRIFFRGNTQHFYVLGFITIAEGFAIPLNLETTVPFGTNSEATAPAKADAAPTTRETGDINGVNSSSMEVLLVPTNSGATKFLSLWEAQERAKQAESAQTTGGEITKRIKEVFYNSLQSNLSTITNIEKQAGHLYINGLIQAFVALTPDGQPSFVKAEAWLNPNASYIKTRTPNHLEVSSPIWYPYTVIFPPKPIWPCAKQG